QPNRAYFGQKDAQQLRVVRKMVADLNLPVEIVPMATIREADGLAMSSRNAYLDAEQRRAAVVLSRALRHAAGRWSAGETSAGGLRDLIARTVASESAVALEYVSVADGDTLDELDQARDGTLISLAARVGATRLIDNVTLERQPAAVSAP